jgi:hypothetical protein
MYIANPKTVFGYVSFSAITESPIDVTDHGYPPEAVAVDLMLGCRSWGDGAYVAAYDGAQMSLDRIAVYPTALMRNQWAISRGRVELEDSKFLVKIRPDGDSIQVIGVLKGYYTADA